MLARHHGRGEAAMTHTGAQSASRRHTNGGMSGASHRSGVFAESVDDNDHHGQGNMLNDQKILENARFGLAKVKLRSNKSSTRRASGNPGFQTRLRRRSSSIAQNWIGRVKQYSWKTKFDQLVVTLRLLDAVYILISVPLRLGFFFDPWDQVQRRLTWNVGLSIFTTLDLMGVFVRVWFAREELLPRLQRALRYSIMRYLRRVHTSDRSGLMSILRGSRISFAGGDSDALSLQSHVSGFSVRGDRVSAMDAALPYRLRSKTSHRLTLVVFVSAVFSCVPLELVVIAVVRNYNILHLVNLTRYPQAFQATPRVFSQVVLTRYRHLGVIQALSFSSVAAIVVLFAVGVYLVHVAGSGYTLLAHIECGLEFDMCVSSVALPGTWVQRDRLEHGSLWRKYVRSMYWGSKTVTTLGQGDLVPATHLETAYRILVQFISGLWATAILTAYSFYFSRKDAKMTTNLTTRLEQATKFLASRRVPHVLAARVQIFFEYMQRTRVGVEEELALDGLPSHYHVQCLNYVKYRSFQRLPLFKNKDGAFLRMILGALEKDYFAPRQIVVDIGDPEEMFVVAKGEISIFDATDAALGRLTAGNAYAESALFYTLKTSRFKLAADTHCEVWALRQADFKEALRLHFSKLKFATVMTTNRMAQAIGRTNTMPSDMAAAAQKFRVNEFKATNKLARKLSTDQTKSVTSSKTQSSSWRKPNSNFQRVWKHTKCALLIMQLYEVPYYIAYQRGFGFTNPPDLPTMGAIPRTIQEFDFVVSVLVEVFFYADWLFRARFFCRFVVGNDAGDAADSSASFGLLTHPSMILRHYRENENMALDIVQNLPLPLVWDILSKRTFDTNTIDLARFIRLLRLVRLHELRTLLRSLMIEHALSPSKRQLVYVVIFVTSSAHIAACLFFLLGDMPSFRGGLPIGGILPDSTTAFDCLRDATLFQNCTWYMYDRSTYNIDSPFLRALQWSVVLQSTVGFGEIMSFSTRESLLGCVWIFLGANICYCIGCILSSILGQLNIHSTIRNERMEEINLALQSASNITEATKVMIRSYYDTKWEMNGCSKRDHDILENLPRSLRHGVCEALYLEDLRSCFLFADDTAESQPSVFLRALARLTRSEIFLKNVMVVREGHLATDFYVIQRGEVELLLPPLLLACPSARDGEQPRSRVIRQASANGKLSWDDQGSLAIVPRANDSRISLSRRSARESMTASVFHSRGMKLSSLDLRLLALRRRQTVQDTPLLSALIPISILQRHDSFGEESITPLGSARTYQANVRVVATAHLAVVNRKDLVALAERFPDEIERIYALVRAKAARDNELFKSLRQNFMRKDKIARRLGIPKSLYVSRKKRLSTADSGHRWRRLFRVIDPEKAFARWWYRIVSSILVYNFYSVIFRVAFLPTPSDGTMLLLTVVDYVCDLVLYVDIIFKFGSLGYIERGEKIMNRSSIRQRYVASWLKQDCWSMLPTFYVGDYFLMTLCRLPRLLRSPQLLLILDDVHAQILEHFLRGNNTMLSSVFDLFRFVLIFVSTAHYVGSLYYLLGRLQLDWGVAERSWINVDFILLQYPDNVWVHYMRTLYWCLSTFTVDCFGDILARNVLETLYSMSTCILGWIFIGQVIGRINMLMITLDKEAQQHQTRVEDFDQYAQQRKLPYSLRRRALQSMSFKTECLIPLRLGEIFHDLPKPLRLHLFNEMHAPILRQRQEFAELTDTQVEAIASALSLEIYLPGDIIYECGRAGTTLFIMQQGLAEVYSPRASIVFSTVETGALFGECVFFIRGAKLLASARAVRSCQVLQLHRHEWMRLWPDSVRTEIECKILKVVVESYRETARSYLLMNRYFYIKNENVKPPRSLSSRALLVSTRRLLSRRASSAPTSAAESSATLPQQQQRSISDKLFRRVSSTRPSSPEVLPAVGSSSDSVVSDGRRSLAGQESETTSSHRSAIKFVQGEKRNGSVTASTGFPQHQSSTSSNPSHTVADPMASTRLATTTVTRESSRRKSSLSSALADAMDQTKLRSSSGIGRRLHLATVPSERHVIRRESQNNCASLPKLSPATELKWKRMEKRLAAIRMFRVAVAKVDKVVETALAGSSVSSSRRESISVMPSVSAALDEERVQLKSCTALRRYSIQVDQQSLLQELLAFEGFENEAIERSQRDKPHDTEDLYADDEGNEYEDDEEGDQDDIRPASSNPERTEIFTLWSFLLELTVGHRRSLRAFSKSNRVAPLQSPSTKNIHEIWVPPRPGPEIFHENSLFRQRWDSIMLCVTIYYALVVPFRACFVHDHMDDPRYGVAVATTFALEYLLTDLPCALDFVLRRHHFEYTEDGETVADRKRIAFHYRHHGTFWMDVVSLVPLEVIAVGVLYLPGQSHIFSSGFYTPSGALPVWRTLAFARINRALRTLVHLHALSDRVQRFVLYELKVAWLRPSMCYVIRLGLDFALGTHWIACFFFGASYLFHVDDHPSWLTTPGMLVFDDTSSRLEDVSRVRVMIKYLRSFHFSIGAVTTVCYGDILPMNALENAATIVVIFLSVGLFSMLSGGFFKFFEMELGKRADYEEKVSQVGQLMVFHQFPSRTWMQMQVFFALSWQESKGMHEHEMLRGLTRSMRHAIACHVHANLLHHVRLLSTCEPAFARALLTVLQHELYVRNDVIIQRGDRGRSMYIIESGLVSIRRPAEAAKKARPSMAAAIGELALSSERPKSAGKLRTSKLIIRDLKSAALAAVSATAAQTAAMVRRPSFSKAKRPSLTTGKRLSFTLAAKRPSLVAPTPASPTDMQMVHALQHAAVLEQQHNASAPLDSDLKVPAPTLKLEVSPKTAASGILMPDPGEGSDGASRDVSPEKTRGKDREPEGSARSGGEDVRFVKGAFDYFGERSLLFGTPRMATCVALCVCSVYVLTLEQYERLLEHFPAARRKNIADWVLSNPKATAAAASLRRP